MSYPQSAIFNLPRFNSDHSPVLLRTRPKSVLRRPNFKCESWWPLKEGYIEVCQRAAQEGGNDWRLLSISFKRGIKAWGAQSKTPNSMLREIEQRMTEVQMQNPGSVLIEVERQLQKEHETVLLMQERYWCQRARVNWATLGDQNTKFFHAMAVTRKRRNTVRALQGDNGEWISDDKEIRLTFINHFKKIYTAGAQRKIADVIPA